jgi:hypothetical protein
VSRLHAQRSEKLLELYAIDFVGEKCLRDRTSRILQEMARQASRRPTSFVALRWSASHTSHCHSVASGGWRARQDSNLRPPAQKTGGSVVTRILRDDPFLSPISAQVLMEMEVRSK